MDIFKFRDELVADYAGYVKSFMRIRDERIRTEIDRSLTTGALWPEPLLQLNPSFEPGASVDELVQHGTLHEQCATIFRGGKRKDDELGRPMVLHRHQTDAIHVASEGHNYVVTTGTGSGKSLAYFIPIINHVLHAGSGKGIKAIVVYPMNALANSQEEALKEFLELGFTTPPVTFGRYTGQETQEQKQAIITNPPDILLTNYVMLELILTRPQEHDLVRAATNLQYLVFDELHTYRGRQGADVAMLIRRVRERAGGRDLQCIGTSATMASEGTMLDKQAKVAEVASRIFGATVQAQHVIGETLVRETPAIDFANSAQRAALTNEITNYRALTELSYRELQQSALASWIETTFGVTHEAGTHKLIRATPQRLNEAAQTLAGLTNLPAEQCETALREVLLAGSKVRSPKGNQPLFAFRLHQFISKGDAIYTTLEDAAERHITLHSQQFAPGRRDEAVLFPLAFCRECGHEYHTAWYDEDEQQFKPRSFSQRSGPNGEQAGYLYAAAPDGAEWEHNIPDDWLEERGGEIRVQSSRRKSLPKTVTLTATGEEASSGKRFQFVAGAFRFCLHCGVSYPGRAGEYTKLNVFSSEGRSTSTTILSLSTVRQLKNSTLDAEARKLLSFTDNRQDAALQAGHFNDFVEVGLLRGALYHAVRMAGTEGLAHYDLPQRVFDVMDLDFAEYAADPTVELGAKRQTKEVMRSVLAYRLFLDLKRGWRITSPNLEQVGLLEIRYPDLQELCETEKFWADTHPALATAEPATRIAITQTLLDALRKSLAIGVDALNPLSLEQLKGRSNRRLSGRWAFSDREHLQYATVAYPRPRRKGETRDRVFYSSRGGFGQYLRRDGTLPHVDKPNSEQTQQIIIDLFKTLQRGGLVAVVDAGKTSDDVPGYQLESEAMRWHAGSGEPLADPLRVVAVPEGTDRANTFFKHFYQEVAHGLAGVNAAEHTAQIDAEDREEREKQFRSGHLPVLYCSPTMELGVDISSLNIVNMRNVPPTPANYAQRSGRAGRSGQPALVFTYCTTQNSHDMYFFKRQEQMVAGAVAPPRLDLANEELIRAHVHAVWLAEAGVNLGQNLSDIIDTQSAQLGLHEDIAAEIANPKVLVRAKQSAEAILANLSSELEQASWYHADWLEQALQHARIRFNETADRWRDLYRAALAQINRQNARIQDGSLPQTERNTAARLHREAQTQFNLLIDSRTGMSSDFFSYRYFASEGFLPGYSFPRLPLSAFIPGRINHSGRDEYVSRPRFLAVSEFGPNAIIYHDGAKYRVNRVVIPPDPEATSRLPVQSAKRCENCGYYHAVSDTADYEMCTRCDARLGPAIHTLLRMESVITRRTERITSDEEERQRFGYEMQTGFRFAVENGVTQSKHASVKVHNTVLAQLEYGQAATITRMNLGWRTRKNQNRFGFALDTENGYWAKDESIPEDDPFADDAADPTEQRVQLVVPFVEDTRNCLVWTPEQPLDQAEMASLQAALKVAIQVEYQLEDSELAAEPLPSAGNRKAILFYEAAEGGAGVLRSLVEDMEAIARVARTALEITHFDPVTGENLEHAPGAIESCEAACYDCLMSYGNQSDHPLLDRFAIRNVLLELTRSCIDASPTSEERHDHLARLQSLTESSLEREFLNVLVARRMRLPDEAQKIIELSETVRTKPDFYYADHYIAVYIDGPHHDYPNRQQRDAEHNRALMDAGYTVLRFHHMNDWDELFTAYAQVFGGTK